MDMRIGIKWREVYDWMGGRKDGYDKWYNEERSMNHSLHEMYWCKEGLISWTWYWISQQNNFLFDNKAFYVLSKVTMRNNSVQKIIILFKKKKQNKTLNAIFFLKIIAVYLLNFDRNIIPYIFGQPRISLLRQYLIDLNWSK